ncbi:MAG: hypothetical protein ABI461_19460 [Polyangiaceae bacterium]
MLFADYVRMLRGHKGVDWSERLAPEDLPLLRIKIAPNGWYPMDAFERMGNAILAVVANNSLDAVRMWGRLSVDVLRAQSPDLVAENDPVETLMRFRVLRSTYFDFEALEIPTLSEGQADIVIRYHMGEVAEEAAAYQTMGFFERMLELGGATNIYARFKERSWKGDTRTLLELSWDWG